MKETRKQPIESRQTRIVKNIFSVILLLYTIITIFLIGNTFLSSFKTKSDLINNTIGFPKEFTLENYKIVLFDEHFVHYFLNSIVLVGLGLFCLVIVSSMVAYGLSQYKFKGNHLLQVYFLIGMMFPIQLGILPLYMILNKLHLINNLFGLVILYTANLSFSVLLISKFFDGFPKEIIESARIDGAGEFMIYRDFVMPISRSVISTVSLLNFVLLWNDFYMPLVFLTRSSVRTLTLAIYSYTASFLANWNKIFAAVSFALLPIIIIYFLFSDQIISGLTSGSIKG